MLKVDVKGIREFNRKLDDLPDRLKKKVLISAYRKAAKPLVKEARARVPKDTRNLEKSISTEAGKRPQEPVLFVGPLKGKRRKYDGWYRHFLEFGTKFMKARPFMRPAVMAKRGEVIKLITIEVSNSIRRFVK